jgi:Ca-activated chloride channel family protein
MNRDFVLQWKPSTSSIPQAALFSEKKDDAHYSMLMLLPPKQKPVKTMARDLIFILDTSGSMQGSSIEQAKKSLVYALNQLGEHDRFNIIEFNSDFSTLFHQAKFATDDNRRKAEDWIHSLKANGGTEMFPALREAFSQTASGERLKQTVFITDGAIGNESQLFKLIESDIGSSRLFTVGIGYAPNSYFMKKAARFGRGTYEYIASPNDVNENMNQLFTKLNSAVSKNIHIDWPDSFDVFPKRVGDLYLNEPLVVFTRSDDLSHDINIEGRNAEGRWQKSIKLQELDNTVGLGSLWARKKIDAVEDQHHIGNISDEELKTKIITLALKHKLLSRFTSFVAVDKTPVRPTSIPLKTNAIPNALAKGQQLQSIPFPKTATPAEFSFWLGLFFLTIVVLIRRMRSDD